MDAALLVKGGNLVIPEVGVMEGSIAIDGGKIVGIYQKEHLPRGKQEIDATGLYIFPGVIQPHAHLGRGDTMADLTTETRSATIGGVTTCLIYHRGLDFEDSLKKATLLSHIDFSFHLQIMDEEQLNKIPHYVNAVGITSFKFNMGYKGEEAKDKDLKELNDGLMYEGFKKIATFPGAIACIHAENSEIIAYQTAKLRGSVDDLAAWSASRPDYAEAEAINRALFFSELTGCPLYIVHMTTALGLKVINEYRKKGKTKVYIETCPQYLTHHEGSPSGRKGKFIPPLRKREDNDALWKGINKGEIDTIGIDQVMRQVEEEEISVWQRKTSPREAVTALPLLITEGFIKRGLPLRDIAKLTALNPAMIFGLYPRKGTIMVGSDADLVLVDLHKEKTVTKELLQSQSNFSLYEGWKLKGWPLITISRGRIIMENHVPLGEPGWGMFLSRQIPK